MILSLVLPVGLGLLGFQRADIFCLLSGNEVILRIGRAKMASWCVMMGQSLHFGEGSALSYHCEFCMAKEVLLVP